MWCSHMLLYLWDNSLTNVNSLMMNSHLILFMRYLITSSWSGPTRKVVHIICMIWEGISFSFKNYNFFSWYYILFNDTVLFKVHCRNKYSRLETLFMGCCSSTHLDQWRQSGNGSWPLLFKYDTMPVSSGAQFTVFQIYLVLAYIHKSYFNDTTDAVYTYEMSVGDN